MKKISSRRYVIGEALANCHVFMSSIVSAILTSHADFLSGWELHNN